MFALPSALLFGGIVAALAFVLTFMRSFNAGKSIAGGIVAFVPTFVIVWIAEYIKNVTYVGYLGGYGYIVFAFAVSLGLAAVVTGVGSSSSSSSRRRSDHFNADPPAPQAQPKSASGLMGGLALLAVVFLVLGYFVTYLYCAVGTGNNARWAELGHITIAPKTEKPVLPDTDPNEMVVMDVHLAYTRAHSVLGSGGNNLGSYYEVNENEGVQQWIAGRNWFVFPLELNGWSEQEGFLTRQISCGAGFIAVPADDPNGDVKIETGLCLKYLPGSYFSLNLQRYVYSHGYKDGYLDDPTIEVDDNWHPYYTVSYVQPAFTVGGNVIVKLLVIDPANGEIKEYAPADVPAWVDRVTSHDLVNEWAMHFGLYHTVPDFWNNNKAGQMKVDTVRMVNTHGQHQVWQVPMLANNDKAISTNGIILYDTRHVQGTFYEAEGASGMASTGTLKAAFENISQNTRGWHVDHIQWYSIKGVPTWMAIYAKEVTLQGGQKQTVFAGIGFLDARDANPSEVKYGSTKEEALESYYEFLSTRSLTGDRVIEDVTTKTVSGTIFRIGHDVLTNGQSVYTIVLQGDARIYNVAHTVSPLLAVAHEGDTVQLTFTEGVKGGGGDRRTVSAFVDKTVEEGMRAAKH